MILFGLANVRERVWPIHRHCTDACDHKRLTQRVRRCVTLMHVLERENHPNRQEGRAKNQGGEC